MLLELDLVLAGQLLVLPLELGDEDLPLDLLLLLQGQQLLLQLLLAHAPAGLARLLTGRGERGHLLLLLVVVMVVHAQVHGDGGRRKTQGQRRVDVHCRGYSAKQNTVKLQIAFILNMLLIDSVRVLLGINKASHL